MTAPDTFHINKITILVTLVALSLLSWRFGERDGVSSATRNEISLAKTAEPISDRKLTDRLSFAGTSVDTILTLSEKSEIRPKGIRASLDGEFERQAVAKTSFGDLELEIPKQIKRPQLFLNGVIRIGKEDGRALFRAPGETERGIWLSVGEEFQGWRLREVDLDSATIEAGGDRIVMRLY